MKYYILFFSFFLFEGLFAQDKVPKTSIYLLEVKSEDNTYTFGDSLIINAPGYYNNQPSFSYNSKVLYYTSILKDKKADIYSCEIKKNESLPFLVSPNTAEYSFQLMSDNKNASFVRVESDDSTQVVYSYPLRGTQETALTTRDLTVGYYCWNNPNSLMLFLLGKKENTLVKYDLNTKAQKLIDSNPGRSILRHPLDGNIYYIRKNDKKYIMMQYNLANEQPAEFVEMFSKTEDFTITPSGKFLSVDNGIVYMYDDMSSEWKKLADFSNMPYKNCYRMAMSPDEKWLALVIFEGEKP